MAPFHPPPSPSTSSSSAPRKPEDHVFQASRNQTRRTAEMGPPKVRPLSSGAGPGPASGYGRGGRGGGRGRGQGRGGGPFRPATGAPSHITQISGHPSFNNGGGPSSGPSRSGPRGGSMLSTSSYRGRPPIGPRAERWQPDRPYGPQRQPWDSVVDGTSAADGGSSHGRVPHALPSKPVWTESESEEPDRDGRGGHWTGDRLTPSDKWIASFTPIQGGPSASHFNDSKRETSLVHGMPNHDDRRSSVAGNTHTFFDETSTSHSSTLYEPGPPDLTYPTPRSQKEYSPSRPAHPPPGPPGPTYSRPILPSATAPSDRVSQKSQDSSSHPAWRDGGADFQPAFPPPPNFFDEVDQRSGPKPPASDLGSAVTRGNNSEHGVSGSAIGASATIASIAVPTERKKMEFRPKKTVSMPTASACSTSAASATETLSHPSSNGPILLPAPSNTASSSMVEVKQERLDLDELTEDVKPDLSKINPQPSPVSAVNLDAAHPRPKSGVLWYRREHVDKQLYDSGSEHQKSKRRAFRAKNKVKLKAEGKKLLKTQWRDDGVAFDWERMEQDAPEAEVDFETRDRSSAASISGSSARSAGKDQADANAKRDAPGSRPKSRKSNDKEASLQPAGTKKPLDFDLEAKIPAPSSISRKRKSKGGENLGSATGDVSNITAPIIAGSSSSSSTTQGQVSGGSTVLPKSKTKNKAAVSKRAPPIRPAEMSLSEYLAHPVYSSAEPTATAAGRGARPAKRAKRAAAESAAAAIALKIKQTASSGSSARKGGHLPTPHSSTSPASEATGELPSAALPATAEHAANTDTAGANATMPSASTPRLIELQASIRSKMKDIHMWTRLMEEYPDMIAENERQVERTKRQIFELQEQIEQEQGRNGGP